MDIVGQLAPYFQRYITIKGIAVGRKYDYAARGMFGLDVLDATPHAMKCGPGEEWLYVAVPEGAHLSSLGSNQRLYVGSQTSDRMFRGDGMNGTNFHHAEMRRGNGEHNLITYLKSTGAIAIHRVERADLQAATRDVTALRPFERLLHEPAGPRKHAGYRFEHAILALEPGRWAWNRDPSEAAVASLVQSLVG